jgi:N-methylhydantoinase B
MYDRTRFPAPGMLGGKDGAAGWVGTASGERLHPKRQQRIPAGERVVLKLPGGGGYGDPLERDPDLVRRDVEDGLVSQEHAREAYGVALTETKQHGRYAVDAEATARLRAEAASDSTNKQ